MSGICAALRVSSSPVPSDDIARMLQTMEAWGSTCSAWDSGEGPERVAMGSRHMRITPQDDWERQPVVSADGAVVLVADAHLDNREELGSALGIPAGDMERLPDSHLILAAWEAWADACCRRLLGDFAFIVWDSRVRTLYAVRDLLGQRVLFWHEGPRGVSLASAPSAIASLEHVTARLNEQKVADFLVLLEDAESTFFDGVRRLAPGHMLVATASGTRIRRYRSIVPGRVRFRSDADYVEAFLDVFGEAVRSRLRCAHPVGMMLSGGLDSSAVAAMAATKLRDQGRRLPAFHSAPRHGFAGDVRPRWIADESDDVRAIAAMHDNIDLLVLRSGDRTPLDSLPTLFQTVGAPVRNPGNLAWVEAIYETAAARGVRVLLTGQRGNATISFTGLRSLRDMARSGRVIRTLREARALAEARGRDTLDILKDLVIRPLAPERLLRLRARVRGRAHESAPVTDHSLIHPEFARAMRVAERQVERRADLAHVQRAGALEYRLFALTAGGDAPDVPHSLRSWFGIETRDPTSDLRVVEYCLSIPGDQYLRAGRDRLLVRRSMDGLLPSGLLNRTTRGAQAADWVEWFPAMREPMTAEVDRLDRSPTARRCLDLSRMRRLLDEWPDRLGAEHLTDYQLKLLRGVVMGRFIRWFEEMYS